MESSDARGGEGKAGVRLFGVMISAGGGAAEEKDGRAREWAGEEIIRKSRSMSNLAAAADPAAENAAFERGYLSEGGLQKSGKRRRRRAGAAAHERKKGVPWTEEEHRTFLEGLDKLGKGDWRGISKKFVLTRTPTQVASHAQKYFIRQTAPSGRRRRSSLFDVVIGDSASTSEAQKGSSMEINLPPRDGKRNEAVVAAAAAAFSGPPRTEDFLAGNGGACEPSGPHPMVGVSGSMRQLSVSGEPEDPPQLSLMLGIAQGREGVAVPSCAPPRPHHRRRLDRSLSGHLRQTQYVE